MQGFKFDASVLEKGLETTNDRAQAALEMLLDTQSLKLRSYAQINARWMDRTGDARRLLDSDYITTANGYRLRLAHGVDYGIWLELANEKKYSIIPETIEIVGKGEILPSFQNLLNKLKGL